MYLNLQLDFIISTVIQMLPVPSTKMQPKVLFLFISLYLVEHFF